jgi:lipopolysaccharide export system permease protein
MFRISDRYILSNHRAPYFLSLGVLTFLFLINIVIQLLELFLAHDVPFLTVLEMIGLSLGHILALTIPMSVLPSTLLAFSQMEEENEIAALRSGGVSLYRIILGPFLATLALMIFVFFFNNFLMAESNHRLRSLQSDIHRKKPSLAIEAGRFIDDIPGLTLYTRRMEDPSGDLLDLYLFETDRGGVTSVVTAQWGRILPAEGSQLRMHLKDGEQFEINPANREELRLTRFQEMELLHEDSERDLVRKKSSWRGDRELNTVMLSERIEKGRAEVDTMTVQMKRVAEEALEKNLALLDTPPQAVDARSMKRLEQNTKEQLKNLARNIATKKEKISRYEVERHKKYAIPFAVLVFFSLGAPLGIKTGRSGKSWGVAFSILLFSAYYVLIALGENLADRSYLPPILATWTPNMILLPLGIWTLYWTNRESRTFSLLPRLQEWQRKRKESK